MRFISLISLLFSIVIGSLAYAETAEIDDWLEMSDACETIVFAQDASVFDDLEPADPLVNVRGLHEVSVFNPNSSLVASAVSSQGTWFLCGIAANPPLQTRLAGSLIQAWSETQRQITQSVESKLIDIDDGVTFNPVRIRCGEGGRLIVVRAFKHENGEFRLGVVNSLPSSIENPCVN
ncbi:hypothetical protein [uncultured Ruegeria sp.]|uniref:hypothetical protein n=1 Tax=uncultured Ruegeria sp. TaxID=259304 RepID=UPI0026289D46|nr:hypothetical protein [uncultured Ruegeria sp.]